MFVSTLSVYPDDAPPGCNEETPTHQPPFPDTEEITEESYGRIEGGVRARGAGRVPRPVPRRPARATSWARTTPRIDSPTGSAVPAAGGGCSLRDRRTNALQVVDVRDLGAFTLDHLEAGTDDVFGVVGPREPLTWSEALAALVEAGRAGHRARVGGRAVPAGAHRTTRTASCRSGISTTRACTAFDASKAVAAGLHHRPLARDDRRHARVGSRTWRAEGRSHARARTRVAADVERVGR